MLKTYTKVKQHSVDSWQGGSADVLKIPPIEKKVETHFFF